jgi:hypothetical protein
MPSIICFYYFQAKDGTPKSGEQILIETLAEAGQKQPTATPAYPPELDNRVESKNQ